MGWNLVTSTGNPTSDSPDETGSTEGKTALTDGRISRFTLIRSRSLTLSIETSLELVEAVYVPRR